MSDWPEEQHSPVSWGAYLGASWTWCIGMFLPVLLVRDYGPWAWVIFALPNCLGAAAMGWVMRSADQSRQYVRDHRVACEIFSLVTIAFQLFFSLWMLPGLVGDAGYVGALIVVQAAFLPLFATRHVLTWAWSTLGVSVFMGILLMARGSLITPPPVAVTPANLLGLSLVCVLGFAACPYLDLTFHRARQGNSDKGARLAFGSGFCVFFASMIVLTFFYAATMFRMSSVSIWLLAVHLTVQLTFTVYVHARALRSTEAEGTPERAALGLALAFGLAAGLLANYARQHGLIYHGLVVGEVAYRIFMSFYGLIFPAYVCLSMWTRRVSLRVLAAIVVIALPFYWMAFIEGRMTWAIVGVGVVFVGALAAWVVRPNRVAFE